MPPIRSFIAIPIPQKIKTEIAVKIEEWTRDFLALNEMSAIRWVSEKNLHITLIFLGAVLPEFLMSTQKMLQSVSSTTSSFMMRLTGFGVFPSVRAPRVLWVGAKEGADKLTELQQQLERALTTIGHKPEERKFHPHLTIARIKTPSGPQLKEAINKILETNYQSELFLVNSIVLFKSTLAPDGPIYEAIKEFKLGS
jgi:2'-5' RNA ligase